MYQSIYYDRDKKQLYVFDDKKGLIQSDYNNYAYIKSPNGNQVSLYGDSCKKITYWTDEDVKKGIILESDIPIETKALIDMYKNDDNVSENHRDVFFDIECEVTNGMPNPKQAKNKITAIGMYERSSDTYYLFILDTKGNIQSGEIDNPQINGVPINKLIICSCKNETELLIKFLDIYEKIKPTVLTGWNIEQFDIPYLYNRLMNVLGEDAANSLSPIGIVKWSDLRERYVIAGVSILDYLSLYKKFTYSEEPSYRLDAIGKRRINIGKVEYSGSLDDLFKNDIKKFIEYNLNDVLIVVKLDDKYKFIDLVKGICHKCHVPYEDVYMSSRFLEGAILTYMRRNNIVCPNKRKIDVKFESRVYQNLNSNRLKVKNISQLTPINGTLESERTVGGKTILLKYNGIDVENNEFFLVNNLPANILDTDIFKLSFPGAFVKEPIAGRYAWLYDLDAKAMYPNIIITLNISPETKLGRVIDWDVMDYMENKNRKYNLIDTSNSNNRRELSRREIKDLLGDEKLKISIAPNGTLYRMNTKGLIPSILELWATERDEYRTLEKKYGKLGSEDYDMDKFQFYNRRQSIQKVLSNSLYGVLGLNSFRFFDIDNAEAVTLTGVNMIQYAQKMVNYYYNKQLNTDNDYVIYVDTDSMFVSVLPLLESRYGDNLDYENFENVANVTLEIVNEVETYVNSSFNLFAKNFLNADEHRFQVKQEVVAESGFWVSKKRYALNKFMENGLIVKGENKLELKGLDAKKSNFPIAFRDVMLKLIKLILKLKGKVFENDRSVTDIVISDFRKKIKEFDILDIATPTSCKGLKKYSTVRKSDFKVKKTLFTDRAKGCPAHINAALNYNDFLKYHKLDKKHELVSEGNKMKWIYLKDNEFNIHTIALKGYDDPKKILSFVETFIDYEKIFSTVLKSKINDFYKALNWGEVSDSNIAKVRKFFKV